MSTPLFVIGHKNPDTDAICSAIGYAELLRRTRHPDAVAASCGAPNARTAFVLERAGLDAPRLVMNVRPTVGLVSRRDEVHYALEDEPAYEVYQRMRKHALKSMPVIDANRKVLGTLSVLDLLRLIMPDGDDLANYRTIRSSLGILRTILAARYQHEIEPQRLEDLVLMVGAMREASFAKHMHQFPAEQLVLIAGDRPEIQETAIQYGVRAIVVTGGFEMDVDLVKKAKARNVTVMSSPKATAMSTLLAKSATLVIDAIDKGFSSFHESTPIADIRSQVQSSQQYLFPVTDDAGGLVGVFAKSDLIDPQRTRLVLVDHNEYGQAVDGAEEADIIEVIDHHRIGGGLSSREPIRFFNDTVGSTSTIVARMFREQAIVPSRSVALCLASGIIADTLHLTSPTSTTVDAHMLGWLEPHAGVHLAGFAKEFFGAGSALQTRTPEEAIQEDSKLYRECGLRFSVAQVEELGLEAFWPRRAELAAALEAHVTAQGLDFACLMITDITRHASLLLFRGDERIRSLLDFPRRDRDLFELNGIVSRKKQLVPYIARVVSRLALA